MSDTCFECGHELEHDGYEKTNMGTDFTKFPIYKCLNPRCQRFGH